MRRILVVEREEGARERLAALLCFDYQVEVAASGEAALDRLLKSEFDLVLLGALGRGRENEDLLDGLGRRWPRPKVILVAPAFCREVLERAAVVGADGVLESRDEEEVAAAVAAHLGS